MTRPLKKDSLHLFILTICLKIVRSILTFRRRWCLYALILSGLLLPNCSRDKSPLGPPSGILTDPVEYGFNTDKLMQAIANGRKLGYLNAMLVWRNGQIIIEQYYNGFGANNSHNIHSVSKSILCMLIGIAREQNLLQLDQKAATFFPEYSGAITDPRVRQIRIDQLLTMTAGFATDEEIYFTLVNSANWVRSTLATSLKYNPGERFSYLTFSSHLLSAILFKCTEQSTFAFGQLFLFKPLGMTCHGWTQDPQGIYFGGNDMFFTPRDLLIFGQACLQQGVWKGQTVIPSTWITEAWKMRIGGTKDWSALKKYGYGYHWWMGQIGGHDAKLAIGHGGQFIVILPDLQMIVVTASKPPYGNNQWETANQQEEAVLGLVGDYVVGAVQ